MHAFWGFEGLGALGLEAEGLEISASGVFLGFKGVGPTHTQP